MRLLSARNVRTLLLVLVASCVLVWAQHAQAPAPTQISSAAPLPVFVTNPVEPVALPDGFIRGSQWRFTTWTMPSVITWNATVNKTSGGWANLTITTENHTTHTRWYYIPNMPGSWERQ